MCWSYFIRFFGIFMIFSCIKWERFDCGYGNGFNANKIYCHNVKHNFYSHSVHQKNFLCFSISLLCCFTIGFYDFKFSRINFSCKQQNFLGMAIMQLGGRWLIFNAWMCVCVSGSLSWWRHREIWRCDDVITTTMYGVAIVTTSFIMTIDHAVADDVILATSLVCALTWRKNPLDGWIE